MLNINNIEKNILTADTARQAEKIGRSWTHHRTSLPPRNMLLNGNYKYTNTNKNRGYRGAERTIAPFCSRKNQLWNQVGPNLFAWLTFCRFIWKWLLTSVSDLQTRFELDSNRVPSEVTQTNWVHGYDFGSQVQSVLHSVILQSQITPDRPKITPDHIRSSQNQSESKHEGLSHS